MFYHFIIAVFQYFSNSPFHHFTTFALQILWPMYAKICSMYKCKNCLLLWLGSWSKQKRGLTSGSIKLCHPVEWLGVVTIENQSVWKQLINLTNFSNTNRIMTYLLINRPDVAGGCLWFVVTKLIIIPTHPLPTKSLKCAHLITFIARMLKVLQMK